MRKLIRNTILLVNIAFALGLAATFLVPFADPRNFWLLSLLVMGQLYLVIVNLAFVLFWLVAKPRFVLLSLIVLVVGAKNIGNFIRYNPRQANSSSIGIKVLSYNTHNFWSYYDKKRIGTEMFDFIAGVNADIICLQEPRFQEKGKITPAWLQQKITSIAYVHTSKIGHWGGPVTFSRYPIIAKGEIRFEDSGNMVIFSDVMYGNDTIRVYNCHLQSFGIQKEEYSIVDSLRFESEKIREAKHIGGKLKRGNTRRASQVDSLLAHIKTCPYEKMIVCGDFNDIPNSYTYSRIANLFVDSFTQAGSGTSNTFRYRIAPFRIDYIFHSKHFESYNYHRYKVDYSDHYPVSVLLLPNEK